jgi:hypothetical protein
MKHFTKFLCLAVLTGLLGTAGSATAQTSTNSEPAAKPAKAAKAKSKAITDAVTKIDNDAKTITIANHDKPFSITSKTKITKEGEPALLSDIMVGDKASIRAKDDETGNPVATSIRIGKAKSKKSKADAADTTAPAAAPAAPATPAAGDSK